jgi:hypothetical protein
MVRAPCDSRAGSARTLTAMRRRTTGAAALVLGALAVACSNQAPTVLPSRPSATTAAPSVVPSAARRLTPAPGVRAPAGVATPAVVRGTIWLGFEACVGLTPGPTSPYLPPPGENDFVVVFPKGWRVVPAHAADPRFGDQFEVLDEAGRVVARDEDAVEVHGVIRAIQASPCGFGWPISAGGVRPTQD